MPKKAESRRQKKIRTTLEKEVGGWWKKIWGGPYQDGGIPDLLGCVEGLFFGFEVKEPGNELDPLQEDEIDAILISGGVAGRVESPEQAVRVVRATLARTKKSRRVRP